ncbi:MAG: hypothetical protein SVE93_04440 [Candidatus Thermoplasmatota archaeon]|nr:hypothetical protein [Candidatus Thermoplasmatota archaeon]
MNIKTVLVAIALLGAFLAYAEQTQAQNPVVDLGAKGAAAVGGGINAIIQTCINTIGASGGLLGAIISVVLSMLNGLISLVMSVLAAVGLGGVAGFCSGAIMGCISGIIGLIAPVIVEILDILPLIARIINTLLTGVGGLIIVLIADILLTIWQMIGYIAMIIWTFIKFGFGTVVGLAAILIGLIPIVSLGVGAVSGLLYAIWMVVFIIIGVLGIYLPIGLNTIISGGIAAWSNIGWYFTALHLADFVPTTLLFTFQWAFTSVSGLTGMQSTGWCGGFGAFAVWIGDFVAFSGAGTIIWIVIAIISLILFALRLYNILPMVYRFCLDTVCT